MIYASSPESLTVSVTCKSQVEPGAVEVTGNHSGVTLPTCGFCKTMSHLMRCDPCW